MAMLGNLLAAQYKGTAAGVARGTVKENWNEKHPGMVKVEMFLGERGKRMTGWVPVLTHYAGDGYGAYCLPETGEAVVIAFELGDISCPIVIGALWDKKNRLPQATANEKNTVKRLLTKGNCEIVCSEEQGKEKITVTTPSKLSVSLEDEKKTICLRDEKGENAVTMDCAKGTIEICAKTKIMLKIGQDEAVTVDSSSIRMKSQDIKQEAQNAFSADAQNIKLSAKANAGMEGKAGTEIKSGGPVKVNSSSVLEIKGSMVKIN